ncbi:TonB-dependent receptor [Luteimonas sp. MC1572]|uniref:TonB-dependent receptor plug domain-containing protein n=1 Tax=Luteimonas sp. MC1572 TaxID=2799325 RepID=UPI0018F07F99|nr:TonB-dependent receptor [Luteimonas sp. MC1572]MBJ6980393.1 TonB-dependent receptor [Luteimonas sp. MC1572]QQO04276.1 TonB-dependent receptor [Luteimonas sp. MC1572]
MNRIFKATLLSQALMLALVAPAALAQATAPDGSADAAGEPRQLDSVVVQGEITYRNRTTDTAPVLSYDLEYFQRFEPNTVGDMVKRLPGAAFVGSDIMEFDGVQLRGMGGGYTQVLINGKKVPGAGDDRSFWVDRIPADMVDRIEILRSNSANRSGDAIAGAINIILRDAYEFDGGYLRVGVNRAHDGEVNPTFGAVASGEALGGRILAGINVQDRYRAKFKRSDRFTDPSMEELASWEDQTEVKDGRDYSGNLSWTADVGDTGRLSVDGFYVKTDRDVTEVSFEEEYDDGEVITSNVPGLATVNQKNWGLGAEYQFDMAGGRTTLSVDHARFEDDSIESEEAHAYVDGEWDESDAEAESLDAKDAETSFTIAHKRPVGAADMEFGLDYRTKKRDLTYSYYEGAADNEGDTLVYALDGVVASVIEEKRLDPYLMFSGTRGILSWETGLRLETTRSDIRYSEDGEVEGAASKDYNELLPSLHLKWALTDADRLSLSLAGSIKRPDFNELVPALLDGEFGDNDYIGNPQLDAETANGLDFGYERRLGKRGVVGINLFYRDVRNLIELVNTGEPSEEARDAWDDMVEDGDYASVEDAMAAEPAKSWLFTSANVGDGKVYGVEFDLSTPLSAFGMDSTGVFLNYAYVKSDVEDFMGTRRFNNQARSAFNVGFIQDVPSLAASFGVTYRKQGDAYERIVGEEVTIRYGEDLEAFVEKRFGNSLSLRLSAANLLDASKDEFFHKFDTLGDQLARDHKEYELETEEAGPAWQLVMRWAF